MLDSVRMGTQKVSKAEYKVRFKELVSRLVVLQQEAKKQELGTVVLFEGWKGAGKGSRISDLLYHLDARDTSVYVTEDFDEKEAALVVDEDFGATGYYPFLQQFWKALGQRGSMTFYDRGWYSVAAQHIINTLPKKVSYLKRNGVPLRLMQHAWLSPLKISRPSCATMAISSLSSSCKFLKKRSVNVLLACIATLQPHGVFLKRFEAS